MQALVFVVIIATFAGLIWRIQAIYQTRFRQRSEDSEAQMQALLAAHRAAPIAPAAGPTPGSGPALSAAMPLLDAPARALLLLLRLELRGLEVLVGVDIAAVCRDTSLPPRTAIDFLVCDKAFVPLCAIFLRRDGDGLRERAAQLLAARGLRVLHWDSAHPPARERIMEIVSGGPTAPRT